jgi:Na+/melibiose symporter-like transporter
MSLAGLALFYGIERALVVSRGGRDRTNKRPGSGIFWLHIAASGLLIFIVAYLLNHREDETAGGLILFFVALLLHFVTADFASRADHPEIYDHAGRWALVGATLAGWITGLLVELPEIAIGCLFAFVGGAMVLVILKEELPEERESKFWPFLLGATLYAGLVLAEFYLTG